MATDRQLETIATSMRNLDRAAKDYCRAVDRALGLPKFPTKKMMEVLAAGGIKPRSRPHSRHLASPAMMWSWGSDLRSRIDQATELVAEDVLCEERS